MQTIAKGCGTRLSYLLKTQHLDSTVRTHYLGGTWADRGFIQSGSQKPTHYLKKIQSMQLKMCRQPVIHTNVSLTGLKGENLHVFMRTAVTIAVELALKIFPVYIKMHCLWDRKHPSFSNTFLTL
jgi:hypothetical protein